MSKSITKRLSERKRRIKKRLAKANKTKYQKAAQDAPPELDKGGLEYVRGSATAEFH